MIPFLDMLVQNVESRFPEMGILGNFNVLAPRRIQEGIMDTKFGQQEMQSLARHFPRLKEEDLLIEWEAFQEQAMLPDLKVCLNFPQECVMCEREGMLFII